MAVQSPKLILAMGFMFLVGLMMLVVGVGQLVLDQRVVSLPCSEATDQGLGMATRVLLTDCVVDSENALVVENRLTRRVSTYLIPLVPLEGTGRPARLFVSVDADDGESPDTSATSFLLYRPMMFGDEDSMDLLRSGGYRDAEVLTTSGPSAFVALIGLGLTLVTGFGLSATLRPRPAQARRGDERMADAT